MPISIILHALCLAFILRWTEAAKQVFESRADVLKRIDGDVSEHRLYMESCRQSSVQESCLFATDDSINQEPWGNECAITTADEQPWWEGRLETPSYITRVTVFGLSDINERGLDALMDFELQAGSHICTRYRAFSSFLNKTFSCDTFSDYLRIQSNRRHSVLALCEIEIYGKAVKFMRNLESYGDGQIPIYGRSCIGSSVHDKQSDRTCHLMADKKLLQNGNAGDCAVTDSQMNPFFEVKLHHASLIRYAIVWNRIDCCQEVLTNFEISVDGQVCARYDQPDKFSSKMIDCNRFGSVVRLTSHYNNSKHHLMLCELQLFGDTIHFIKLSTSKYLGCYKEKKQKRDVEQLVAISRMSPEKCARICRRRKKPFFGLQQGKQCWCSERYGLYGMAAEDACWMPCDNSDSKSCGAKLYNSIYEVQSYPGEVPDEE